MNNNTTYNSYVKKAQLYGEVNDCAVKAVAVVLNTSYEDAHTLLKTFGRKDGCGTNFYTTTKPALQSRGFIVKRVEIPGFDKYSFKIKTISNLEQSYFALTLKNPLLITTSRHIIGFKNCKAHDFTSGRRYRILDIHEIISTKDSINSVYIDSLKINIKHRKKENSYKFALQNIYTGEIYKKYKRKPSAKLFENIRNHNIWIIGKKKETQGKLIISKIEDII